MYVIGILFGLKLFSFAICLDDPGRIQILKYEFDNIGTGSYNFNYENSDGSFRQEFGHILLPGTEDEHMKVNGSYSYIGPDGVTYTVKYTADDQGFHPEGDHIQVPPFVPWIHHHGGQNTIEHEISERPKYTVGERILDTFRTTPKPTTQYLPHDSESPNYSSGENILSTARPNPTTQYLPTSTPSYGYSSDFLSSAKPQPELIINSLPSTDSSKFLYSKTLPKRGRQLLYSSFTK